MTRQGRTDESSGTANVRATKVSQRFLVINLRVEITSFLWASWRNDPRLARDRLRGLSLRMLSIMTLVRVRSGGLVFVYSSRDFGYRSTARRIWLSGSR